MEAYNVQMTHPQSEQVHDLERRASLLNSPGLTLKRMLPFIWKEKKKNIYSFTGRKNIGIPEDDNILLVWTSQKIFMPYDLQYPAKFNSYNVK